MKNKRNSKMIYGLSFFIFLAIFVWGKFFLNAGDEMGYVILNFYILMPLTSFIMALILALKDINLKWLYPIIFGVLGMIIPILIFSGSWSWISILFSPIPGFLGLFMGLLVRKLRQS